MHVRVISEKRSHRVQAPVVCMRKAQSSPRFARIATPGNIWAVASINGDALRLRQMHAAIDARLTRQDTIIYLGNYYGPHPKILETVQELIKFRRHFLAQPRTVPDQLIYLRGQREDMLEKLLQLQFSAHPKEALSYMIENDIGSVLEAYGSSVEEALERMRLSLVELTHYTLRLRSNIRMNPGHYEFMSLFRRAAYTADEKLLFVHAGVDPSMPMDKQGDNFWWGHRDFIAMERQFEGFRRVFAGYSPYKDGLQQYPVASIIDNGSGMEGTLMAACIDGNGNILELLET